MSSSNASFTDDELIHYLDATLTPQRAEQVQQALSVDPELSGRMARLAVDTNSIRQAFDDTLQAAPPVSLDDVLAGAAAGPSVHTRSSLPPEDWNEPVVQPVELFAGRGRTFRFLAMAASLLLAAGVGLLAGLQWLGQPVISNNWQTAIVQYHDLYALETLPAQAPAPDQIQQQLALVSERSGLSVSASMVDDLPGLQFRRAQTLTHQGEVLIQLAFLSRDSKPVVLCFMRTNEADALPVADTVDGMDTVRWSRNGFAFILAGKQSAGLLAAAVPAATSHF